MRIAQHSLKALVAVLSLAAILFFPTNCLSINNSTIVLHRSPRNTYNTPEAWSKIKQEQLAILKRLDEGKSIACCPSEEQMTEPLGGRNQQGMYVKLYRTKETKQRFFEVSCLEHVVGKPCLFMERKMHNFSRCVQKYTHTYALVQEYQQSHFRGDVTLDTGLRHQHHVLRLPSTTAGPTGSKLMLDYIRVRSGCICEITPVSKKKRGDKTHKKSRNKKVHHERSNSFDSVY